MRKLRAARWPCSYCLLSFAAQTHPRLGDGGHGEVTLLPELHQKLMGAVVPASELLRERAHRGGDAAVRFRHGFIDAHVLCLSFGQILGDHSHRVASLYM